MLHIMRLVIDIQLLKEEMRKGDPGGFYRASQLQLENKKGFIIQIAGSSDG